MLRQLLSRALLGLPVTSVGRGRALGVCPSCPVPAQLCYASVDRSDKRFSSRHVAPLEFVFEMLFAVLLPALPHGGWAAAAMPGVSAAAAAAAWLSCSQDTSGTGRRCGSESKAATGRLPWSCWGGQLRCSCQEVKCSVLIWGAYG